MKRILIVDDDNSILELLVYHFERENFEVKTATDGLQALAAAHEAAYDLLLLDLMLPGLTGIELTQKLRQAGDFTPILILTAREDDESKLRGLGLGADDYLDKTTPLAEIVVRVKGLIRRAQDYDKPTKTSAKFDSKTYNLSKFEYEILQILISHASEPVPRDKIIKALYQTEADIDTRSIDVLISRIRKKIAPARILSKRGFGYYFEDENES